MWTSNSVWVGQIIKVPVIDQKGSLTESSSERKLSNESSEKTDSNQTSVSKKDKRRLSTGSTMGPSPTEFWTKMDSSIEESKKVTSQLKNKTEKPFSLTGSAKDDKFYHIL